MSFRTIENDIKNGALDRPAPILLCGEERYLVAHYEKRLLEAFGGGPTSNPLDISIFYGDDANDDQIMAALDTFPMLSPVRTVLVKNHTGFSATGAGGQELAAYIAQLPETARAIFTANQTNKTRALYKAVAKSGAVYEFVHLGEADLAGFVRKRFKAHGAAISETTLDAFIFATGYLEKDTDKDLFTVENDAYKAAMFALACGRAEITQSDIEECLPSVLRTDVFAMLDAISSGKKGEAVRLLENSLAGGESAFRLLSLFTGQFEIMHGYKELSAQGRSPSEITKTLGERSDWRVKKLGGFAKRFEPKTLERALIRLYGIERDIKSGDVPERLALTLLIAEI